MGIVSHTAHCGVEASELIRTIPIHVAVVDLAIPLDGRSDPAFTDDAGIRLLEVLSRLDSPPPTVVIKRGLSGRDDNREMTAALRAGAFSVVDRPRDANDLESMLEVLRRILVRFYQGRWPGAVPPPNFA
jgi:DNA-binding NarL/FixJ family response regulator